MKKINKSVLKENYYYESRPFFDALPDKLIVPPYRTEIFDKTISHKNILKAYKVEPYGNVQDAFAVIADCIPTLKGDYNGRLAYFTDTDGTLCRLYVWRGDVGELYLDVDKVSPDGGWDAGDGVLASNHETETLVTDHTLELGDFDPLPGAIRTVKEAGYIIYKQI